MTSTPATTDYPEDIDAAVLKVAGVVVLGAIMSVSYTHLTLPTNREV